MGTVSARFFDSACPQPRLSNDLLPMTRSCLKSSSLSRTYDLLTPAVSKSDFCELRTVINKRTNEVNCLKTFNGTLLSPNEREFIKSNFQQLSSLDHPNLLKVHSVLEDSDGLCVVSDNFSPTTLNDHLLATEGRLPASQVYLVLSQLFSLLDYLHSHKISYGNFDPKELLFNGQTVKVYNLEHSLSTNYNSFVSTGFAAPEVILRGKSDFRADFWSLGVLAYVLLTGRHPFLADSQVKTVERVLRNKPIMPVNHLLVSEDEKELLSRLLSLEPATRPTRNKAFALRFFCSQESAHRNKASLLMSLVFKNGSSDSTVNGQTIAFRLLYVCWSKESFQWTDDVVSLFRILDVRAVGRVTRDDILATTANDPVFRKQLLLKLDVWGSRFGHLVIETFMASFLADLIAVRPINSHQFAAQFPRDDSRVLRATSLAHTIHPALRPLLSADESGIAEDQLSELLFGH